MTKNTDAAVKMAAVISGALTVLLLLLMLAVHFKKAPDSVDKYLNAGNASFRMGESESDPNMKAQHFLAAMNEYMDGIKKYPQDMPIKYNYETAKEKLKELANESQSDQKGGGEDSGEQGDEQNESGSGEQSGENNEEQGEQGGECDEQSGESDEQSGDESNGEQGEQEADAGSGDENDDAAGNENDDAAGNENDDAAGEAQISPDDITDYDPDRDAINRILAMLENKEEESLKNNQGVVRGKDEVNGW